MAEISQERLDAKLATIPREKHDAYRASLAKRGHTIVADVPVKTGAMQKIWDTLAVPEKMSREGLGKMAGYIQDAPITGNMPLDVALGAPKIGIDTVAEAAPGFVSRESILTAGLLKGLKAAAPVARFAGRTVAKGAEGISGLEYKTPGVLVDAANDPTLLFGKGKAAAGKAFELIKNNANVRPSFLEATSHGELLQDAKAALSAGTLSPEEAIIARRTVDKAWNTIPRDSAIYLREQFDKIAKPLSESADKGFQRAIKSDALRAMFAQNKTGGTSVAKNLLGILGGGIPNVAMSPIVQGTVASGLGATSKALAPLAKNAVRSGAMFGGAARTLEDLKKKKKEDEESK